MSALKKSNATLSLLSISRVREKRKFLVRPFFLTLCAIDILFLVYLNFSTEKRTAKLCKCMLTNFRSFHCAEI